MRRCNLRATAPLVFVAISATTLCSVCLGQSSVPSERFVRLYESFMAREGLDGKRYGLDGVEPLLWRHGEFLLKGASRERFLAALRAFSSQSAEAFASYTNVERAVMQRQLWAVFDWSADRGRGRSEARREIQRELAGVIRRLSLPRSAIEALPDTHAETVKTERYGADPDPKDRFKPFFPARLFEAEGPWVCLRAYPIVAKTHSIDDRYRSAFTIFARLPGGRKKAVEYFDKLLDFRENRSQAKVPAKRTVPQIPTGTRFALVRRALLIDDKGGLVVSPLVETIQVRAYIELHDQAVAEFNMNPRKLIAGDASMRAESVKEPGFQLFVNRILTDPFLPTANRQTHWNPPWTEGGTPRLKTCSTCHSAYGIHSMASNTGLLDFFERGAPRRLLVSRPDETWKAAIRGKWATYEWGYLEGLWNK